jgi:hypothetical protein
VRFERGGDVPWQQLLDSVDRVIGDALEYMPQIRLRVDAV